MQAGPRDRGRNRQYISRRVPLRSGTSMVGNCQGSSCQGRRTVYIPWNTIDPRFPETRDDRVQAIPVDLEPVFATWGGRSCTLSFHGAVVEGSLLVTSKVSGGVGRRSNGGGDPDDDGDASGDEDNYARPCTWAPDSPCWLMAQLERWNRQLSKGCFELRQHKWPELTISGFQWPRFDRQPEGFDILRVSLLIHLLLRQHRCITRVDVDFQLNALEELIFWDAIRNGAGALTHLTLKLRSDISEDQMLTMNIHCVRSVPTLTSLESLKVSYVCLEAEVARLLGVFVVESRSLITLWLHEVQDLDDSAGTFLDDLVLNKSLKNLHVCETFLMARNGEALANVVRNHYTIESVEVTGGENFSPSALLKAAVRSRCLRRLYINSCTVDASDIEEMAEALSRRLTLPSPGDGWLPSNRLEELAFNRCVPSNRSLERAYASLIRGALGSLALTACSLGQTFSRAAALNLRYATYIRKLNLKGNYIGVSGFHKMIKSMKVNKSLQTLAFSIVGRPRAERVGRFFNRIRKHNLASRLDIHWADPEGVNFSDGVQLCKTSSADLDLNRREAEDANLLLEALASSSTCNSATLECGVFTIVTALQTLVTVIGATRFLRTLSLNVDLRMTDGLSLLVSLERNRSVQVLNLSNFPFNEYIVMALEGLISGNRCINVLDLSFPEAPENAKLQRLLGRMLKLAIPNNRMLVSFEVKVRRHTCATGFNVKETLRRNLMLVHRAARFVNGCDEKRLARAFELLQHAYSLIKFLTLDFTLPEEDALVRISKARTRLAANYFIYTGVVRARVACYPVRGERTTLETLGADLIARICSHLKLRDVRDR
ncbi:hypothetical protein HPB50_000675 [Hyalomma asiaticum]|uniref:Uncharacterized protein n=1 Tax=Hyalomma asiaticum TaxID=266040 RepID=A0ACB7RGR4_HYAAI|nr:hypothetical protein HPB50_000675 [Hyalomma asiaticum]